MKLEINCPEYFIKRLQLENKLSEQFSQEDLKTRIELFLDGMTTKCGDDDMDERRFNRMLGNVPTINP